MNEKDNYEISVEYPQFHSDRFIVLNERVLALINRECENIVFAAKDPDRFTTLRFGLSGSFSVALLTPLLSSIRFSFSSYTGGAHGNGATEVMNYRLDQSLLIDIKDLFIDAELGISTFSDYCINELLKVRPERDEDWVRRGASPVAENFANFNLSPYGASVVFGEYQVGCYAEGKSEVVIPYSVFRPLMSPLLEELVSTYGSIVSE